MAYRFTSPAGETPEEAEQRRRAATARRIKILIGLTVVTVVARVMLKDPKRKAPIDYSKVPVTIGPGMLDSMPAAARARLDPQLVAKMVLADEEARRQRLGIAEAPAQPAGEYKPADMPTERDIEAETYKEQMFAYARRRRIESALEQRRIQEARDIRLSTVIQFTSGGYLRAETAEKRPTATFIRLNNTIEADVPNRLVASIQKDAVNWQEPVPPGQVRLKPAKGITVIVHRDTARRITVEKSKFDEI